MKFQLTLEITRTPKVGPEPEPEPPVLLDVSGAQVEHAGQQRVGFYAAPSRDWEDI